MTTTSQNAKGALFMAAAMACYVVNDTFMKLVAQDLPLFQAIFIRGAFATTLLGLFALKNKAFSPEEGLLRALKEPALVVRVIAEALGTWLFLNALFSMPIANVTAVLQLLPLTVTLGAALFFGEKVGWRRYGAIIAGFLGVLLIIRPDTGGFDIFALSALGATVAVTVRDLATKRLRPGTNTLLVSFATAIAITILSGAFATLSPWASVSTENLIYMLCAATVLICGYVFSVLTMRVGEVSFTAPFRYSIMIWAILLGIFVFGEFPDALALTGTVIIVASGLFTFYRERRLSTQST